MSTIFGQFSDSPRPYSFNGTSGFWSVPAGKNWYLATDSGGQQWASPDPLTRNQDGTVSETAGSLKYAVDMNGDGTLVFIEALANRKLNIDSPGYDRLSQSS